MKPTHPSLRRFALAAFTAAVFTHVAAPEASAATYWWDSNGTEEGFGAAAGTWAAPTVGDETQGWSTSSTGVELPGEVTTTTADLVNFGSAAVGLATGTITVSETVSVNRITIPPVSGAITLTGGSIELGGASPQIIAQNDLNVINSDINLGANSTILFSRNTNSASTITINGEISGPFNLTFTTPNVNSGGTNQFVVLGSASSYTGNTTITAGNLNNTTVIRAGVQDALPPTTVLTLDGGNGTGSGRTVTFDLNSKNQTIAGLTNVTGRTSRNQRIANNGSETAILTINSSTDRTFSGNINGTNLGLTKLGAAAQTLAAGNGYTGPTTVSGGKLIGRVGGNHSSSDVTVSDESATYGVSITNSANSWTSKSLKFSAAGTLEFNFGAVAPSATVNPLVVTELADFSEATPQVDVIVTADLLPGVYPLVTWGDIDGPAPTTANLFVSQVGPGTVASLSVSANTLNLVITGDLSGVVKANNTNDLNLGSSWVGGLTPGADELARWNNTVTSANTTVLGAEVTWGGVLIENPGGPVTINGGGNSLGLGTAPIDIDMSEATTNLTLNCPLELTGVNVWNMADGRTLTLTGEISGSFPITKMGAGTAVLSGLHSYTGVTTVGSGTLRLAEDDTLPFGAVSGDVVVNGTLDLNGRSQTINGLSGTGSGVVDNTAAGTTSTFTIGTNNAGGTFGGVLANSGINATLNLVKTGTGTSVLGGVNTLGGTVTIASGTLGFDKVNPLDFASEIQIGGGATLRPDVVNGNISIPISIGAAGTTATITAPSIQGAGGTSPVPFSIDGQISGDGNVRFAGIQSTNAYGRISLNAQNDYAGSTLITCLNSTNTNIFIRLGTDNALPVTTVLTLDGGNGTGNGRFCQLDLLGFDQTLAGLSNVARNDLRTQRINNTDSNESILTVNNSEDFTYSGQLGNGGANMGLTKSGSGTFTLAGNNAYTGATVITGGTLALGASNVLNNTTAVSIGNAALSIGSGFSDTVGTLDATASATIQIGAGGSLAFADSSAVSWAGGSLTISGAFVSGSSLRFGADANGLTAEQIALISANNFSDFAINDEGFLTATSTASGFSAWITGTFANGTIPLNQQGPNDDPDNDGVSNLIEYAIAGLDPTVPNPSVGTFTAGTLGFTKRDGTTGLTYAIQQSTDLGGLDTWKEVTGGSYVNNASTISFTVTPGTPPKNFLRLQVTTD